MTRYEHTQPGTVIRWSLLTMSVVFAGLGFWADHFFYLTCVVLLLAGWLFHSLTIIVTAEEVRWRFGPGLIRGRKGRAEIISARAVRTTWLEGWGIHFTRYGWLYNVSGFDAVELTLANGKRMALGTDEPATLLAALDLPEN